MTGPGKWSSIATELTPLRGFYGIVTKLADRARERGEIGEGGAPVWSLAEWARFIRAARESQHLESQFSGLLKTVVAVETLIDAGKTAREIHQALYWASRDDDTAQEKKAKLEADEVARGKARARELAVQAEMELQRVRAEARERVKSEFDAPRGRRRLEPVDA